MKIGMLKYGVQLVDGSEAFQDVDVIVAAEQLIGLPEDMVRLDIGTKNEMLYVWVPFQRKIKHWQRTFSNKRPFLVWQTVETTVVQAEFSQRRQTSKEELQDFNDYLHGQLTTVLLWTDQKSSALLVNNGWTILKTFDEQVENEPRVLLCDYTEDLLRRREWIDFTDDGEIGDIIETVV